LSTISVLQKLHRETAAEVFITGGFVRDFLRDKGNKDLDIVVRSMPMNSVFTWLKRHGTVKRVKLAQTNDAFSVSIVLFKAPDDDLTAQLTLPKRKSPKRNRTVNYKNTLQQDVKCRDFTINAMYLPIHYKSKKDVIDLSGGRDDIRSRVIRTVGKSEPTLIESPIRIMRAISLAARTNYRVDNELVEAITKQLDLLFRVPMDNIRNEIDKIILSKRPSKYFKLMEKIGILKIVMPELYGCVGVTQNTKYHKFDVFKHSLYAMDNSQPILELRLAALLHDVGKSVTRKETPTGITFHKHEIASTKMAKHFLMRLGYSNKIKKAVTHLVRHHMYHYTREWSDAAVRRFMKTVGIGKHNIDSLDEFPLFKLRAAERLGNGLKKEAITERQKDFQRRIEAVFRAGNVLSVKDLDITGYDIMAMFNLSQGQKVGSILTFLLERVIENPQLNKKTLLLKEAVDYLSKEGE